MKFPFPRENPTTDAVFPQPSSITPLDFTQTNAAVYCSLPSPNVSPHIRQCPLTSPPHTYTYANSPRLGNPTYKTTSKARSLEEEDDDETLRNGPVNRPEDSISQLSAREGLRRKTSRLSSSLSRAPSARAARSLRRVTRRASDNLIMPGLKVRGIKYRFR